MHFFITGTDTNVGKTYVTVLLLQSLRRRGVDAVGMKPIETGGNSDAQRLQEAADGCAQLSVINPICLNHPLAPAVAAEKEGKILLREKIFANYRSLCEQFSIVLVEGAGGWKVPIATDYEMADLASDLSRVSPLQVIVVALNRLGTINHTLLTIESIRARGLECAGFILNYGPISSVADLSAESNAQWIARHSGVPFWGEIGAAECLPSPSLLDTFFAAAQIPKKS